MPYLLIITNRYYENESVMYKELRTLRGYFSPPYEAKKNVFHQFLPISQSVKVWYTFDFYRYYVKKRAHGPKIAHLNPCQEKMMFTTK